jgi:hypothetical protein
MTMIGDRTEVAQAAPMA